MSGKKPKKQMMKLPDIERQSELDWRRNNANYNNYYGSSTTTFDGDQATVNQQYSEPVQQLADQRMDFLSGGPQQYQAQSNPFLDQMFTQSANNVSRRAGNEQKPMPQGQPANPELSFGYGNPQAMNKPLAVEPEQKPNMAEQLGGALQTVANGMPPSIEQHSLGGGGYGNGVHPFAQMIQNWQQRKQDKPIDYQTGR